MDLPIRDFESRIFDTDVSRQGAGMAFHRASVLAVLLGSVMPGAVLAGEFSPEPLRLALAGGLERPPEPALRHQGRSDRAAVRRAAAIGAPLPPQSVGQRALEG